MWLLTLETLEKEQFYKWRPNYSKERFKFSPPWNAAHKGYLAFFDFCRNKKRIAISSLSKRGRGRQSL